MTDELKQWAEDKAYIKGQIDAYTKIKDQLIDAKKNYEKVVGRCGYTAGLSVGIEIADNEITNLKGE